MLQELVTNLYALFKGRLVGAKLFLKASQGAVRTISLSTFSHEYHIRTSCQRTPEFDQSFGHLLSFRTPLMPDRLVSSLAVWVPATISA